MKKTKTSAGKTAKRPCEAFVNIDVSPINKV